MSNSRSSRERKSREVTYCPSRPANGEVFTVKTIASVGSSIISGSSGAGFSQIGDAFADLNSFHARDGHDIAGINRLGFIAFEPAEREELGDFGRLNRRRSISRCQLRRRASACLETRAQSRCGPDSRCNRDW